MSALPLLLVVIPLLCGAAVLGVSWLVGQIATCPRASQKALGRFEHDRRVVLRERSWIYRVFEPWIDELALSLLGRDAAREKKLKQDLLTAAEDAPWEPTEYIAARRVEAVLAGIVGALFGWMLAGMLAAAAGGVLAFYAYQSLMLRQISARALLRRNSIRRRFAAMIDLMALMMEVGGSFQECLAVVTHESRGHPLGEEMLRMQKDLALGRPRKEALKSFAERVADDDINELIVGVIEGEEYGTPLAEILRTQADQMRQKRSQWAERAAEESQVLLVFPAMIIMIACLITVAAPFVLSALYSYKGM